MPARTSAAVGLLTGYAADLVVPDPPWAHPVAGFGRGVQHLERVLYADRRDRGVLLVLASAGAVTGLAVLVGRVLPRRGPAPVAATALVTWAVVGGASLSRTADALGSALDAGDLGDARALLPSLCGRDPEGLDADGLARAAVESVAENTSDAVVAPLWWGAVAGVPGLVAYRAVNTLDAMVGHRTARYRRFGWAAARLDDAANLVPARLTGLLAAACAPLVGGTPVRASAAVRRDGARHPSPNAGRCEAAFAGALGVRLGGETTYAGHVEQRGPLGDGRTPRPRDVTRAVRLGRAVGVGAALVSAAVAAGRTAGRAHRRSA